MYYTYMLRCEDDSLYTGMTTDVKRRMEEHFSRDKKCAKYTLRHKAKKLEGVWESETRKLAAKLEYQIKTLSKSQKEELIKRNDLEQLLGERIEVDQYKKIK